MKHATISLVLALFASPAIAKTVALWPLEQDKVLGTVDLRCAVSSANDFIPVDGLETEEQTVGWYLPPNPDTTDTLLFLPGNRFSIVRKRTAFMQCKSAEVSRQMDLCRDFTLEGWVSPKDIADNAWYVLANVNGGSTQPAGFIWSIRKTRSNETDATKKDITFEIYTKASSADWIISRLSSEEDKTALTNAWHHLALVFTCDADAGKSRYEIFYDGVSQGFRLENKYGERSTATPGLQLGGRESGNYLNGSWDYWRLSDTPLAPEEFLCTGVGTPEPAVIDQSTVAYWPLCAKPDGSVDVRDYVGGADLHLGLLDVEGNMDSGVAPDSDSAFSGNPPNSTVTLPNGNDGSIVLRDTRAKLKFSGLGDYLETTNSFTVEGWFKPEERDNVAAGYKAKSDTRNYHYLFNTRTSGNGWVLEYDSMAGAPGIRFFRLLVQDGADFVLNDESFGSFGPGDPGWMHIALVYDHTDGNGVWSLYVNGRLLKSVENKWSPTGPSGGHDFMMGGRYGEHEVAFGKLDCVRLSQTALSPRQFLNATENPLPATGVLALWPLNVKANGLALDLTDVATGAWSGSTGTAYTGSDFRPNAVVGDAPEIANPDVSGAVRSDLPSGGSIELGRQSFLMTCDGRVLSALNGEHDYTWECYLKQPVLLTSGWSVVMYLASSLSRDNGRSVGAANINFSWRPGGFTLLDVKHKPNNTTADVTASDSKDSLGAGAWHHVAVTFARRGGAGGKPLYKLYVDGLEKGSWNCQLDATATHKAAIFFGRFWDRNSFNGQASSMRLSNRVLAPVEFLCGSQPLPSPTVRSYRTGTVAYWPFENYDGEPETLDRTGAYAVSASTTYGVVSGITEGAVSKLWNPDVQTGGLRANVGAVALASGVLPASSLGLELEYDRAFTVEGWWRSPSGAALLPATLFGTYVPSVDAGWKVYMDSSSGRLQLKVLAKHLGNWSPVADGALIDNIEPQVGSWSHLAVVYNPSLGLCGRWTAYVDGKEKGAVDNVWRNCRWHCELQRFDFGASSTLHETGFAGDLDQWRVSGAALSPDAFLWRSPRGMILCFR